MSYCYLHGYKRWRDCIQPQNLDLTVFILGRTVEALTHAAVIECPELLSNGQLEQEITTLLLVYLQNSQLT